MFSNSTRLMVLACGTLIPAAAAVAGPLNPPGGPVTSTYKTLTEVEPRIAVNAVNTPGDFESLYVISTPGSYYLTGNVSGVNGKKGIKINANGVTLDLAGFTMVGNAVGDDAIFSGFGSANITVRNGTIRDWIKEAVDGYNSPNCRIENLVVDNSVNGYGLITGPGSIIIGCTVRNSGAGIITTDGSTVRDCVATGNVGGGIGAGNGNTIVGCTAQDTVTGFGIQTGAGCTVSQCTAYNNKGATGHGFNLGSGCTVTACTANNNDQDGFKVQAGALNVSISGCTAAANRKHGIETETGVGFLISNNVSSRNSGNGIQITGSSAVLNNTCEDNGTVVGAQTSGIYVTFSYNRIDGNHVLGSAFGIAVASGMTNNLVIRNTATLCTTPYSFPAGVTFGAINFLPSGSFADTNSFANLRF